MVFSVTGFHTCQDKGGVQAIRAAVPFISKPDNQWLGQGYYFWTDSDYWAKQWMRDPKVISQFTIELEKNQVLDLVGNVSDQELFQAICELFNEDYPLYEEYVKLHGEDVSVGAVISFLRRQDAEGKGEQLFPFAAVRAKDNRCVKRVLFVSGARKELSLVEPHQLCVYREYKEKAVSFERFVHPEHYC